MTLTRRGRVALTLAALAAALTLAVATHTQDPAAPGYGQTAEKTQPSQERIFEDDPRWDCHTMGNRICGPGQG